MSGWGSTIIKSFCALGAIVHFNTFIISIKTSCDDSMSPTIGAAKERFLVNYLFGKKKTVHKVGDIVLSRDPEDPNITVIKRVRAVSGDIVVTQPTSDRPSQTVSIPRAYIWIEGDNNLSTSDSRKYGPIPENMIEGTIFFRILPLQLFGHIKGDPKYYTTHPNHSIVYKPWEYHEICEKALSQEIEKERNILAGNNEENS